MRQQAQLGDGSSNFLGRVIPAIVDKAQRWLRLPGGPWRPGRQGLEAGLQSAEKVPTLLVSL